MSNSNLDSGKLYDAILTGDAKTAVILTEAALADNQDPQELVTGQMIPAMDEVGKRFEAGEYYVPELLIAARAMKGALELLRPLLAERGVQPVGHVVLGTVQGDLHDIGKDLVGSMLEGAGFEIVDLGADVTTEEFVMAVKDSGADVVALSALLTTTMGAMENVIEALQEKGLRDQVKVIVGGAPVTQRFADKIGADGYSSTAYGAVGLTRELLGC